MNKTAYDLIASQESLRLHAYPDPVSHGPPFTIGFGATGPNIGPHTIWTEQQAIDDLQSRINVIQKQINDVVNVIMDRNMEAAIISFVYNCGFHTFQQSKMLIYLNNQDYQNAADDFLHYNHAEGKVIPNLTKRRSIERTLFLTTT